MSANIAHFTARSEPAWWDRDGVHTFDQDADWLVSDAMIEANMDYEFLKVPQFIEINGHKVETGYYTVVRPPVDGFIGEQIESDENPDDDGSELHIFRSSVSEDFELIQNMELAAILDPIAEEWPVETVGAIRHGERTFVLLRAGEHEVKGHDLLKTYFLVADDKTGGLQITVQPTDVRVQCMNTLSAAFAGSDHKIKIPHTAGAKENVELAMTVMQRAREQKEEVLEMYDAFADYAATDEELEQIVEQTFPEPSMSGNARIGYMIEEQGFSPADLNVTEEKMAKAKRSFDNFVYNKERTQENREECLERVLAFNEANPRFANTIWAGYNAATDYADWRNTGNLSAHSVLMGGRAKEKQRAFDACVELIQN